MGTVYRAQHTHLRRPVALKLLRPERLGNPTMRQRFFREAAAVGRLDHPHIVRATDAGEDAGRPFLVMELLDGLDLQKVLRHGGPLPVADACEIVRQAALGLQCAHERGLVHRDVKPSNLLLTSQGCVKVLDLGLAHLGTDPLTGEEHSLSEPVLGTADYMAPEQATAPRQVDARADVYGLGCTLYALLTGSPPFAGRETLYQKMKAHAEEPPVPLGVRRSDLPAPLTALVDRMLSKNPAERPASAGAVAAALAPYAPGADLRRLIADAPPPVFRPTLSASSTPTVPATPVPARWPRRALAALVLTVVPALLAVALWPAEARRPPVPPAPPPPPPGKPGDWQPLLAEPPEVLYWPAHAPNSEWRHDPAKRELRVAAIDGLGLFRLGDTQRDDFDLRVAIRQAQWDRVGLFFGRRLGELRGRQAQTYELVTFTSGAPAPNAVWELQRLRISAPLDGGPGGGHADLLKRVAVRTEPGLFDLELSLSVRRGRLVEVRWAGEAYDALTAPEVDALVPPGSHRGALGVAAERCQAVFRDAAFRIPPEVAP
jgi:serine/threonine protein kinase